MRSQDHSPPKAPEKPGSGKASYQLKKPHRVAEGLFNGGGAGNRTRVRRSYTEGFYMLVPVFKV